MSKLKDKGVLKRIGPLKGGYWEVEIGMILFVLTNHVEQGIKAIHIYPINVLATDQARSTAKLIHDILRFIVVDEIHTFDGRKGSTLPA